MYNFSLKTDNQYWLVYSLVITRISVEWHKDSYTPSYKKVLLCARPYVKSQGTQIKKDLLSLHKVLNCLPTSLPIDY